MQSATQNTETDKNYCFAVSLNKNVIVFNMYSMLKLTLVISPTPIEK